MASATFRHSITIDAPQDEVWDRLQEPGIWSSIGPVQNLWDPVVEDGVLTGFQWSTDVGGVVYKGTGSATVLDRPDQYQLVLDTPEMAGTITVDLAAGNPGSTVADVNVEFRSKGLLSSMFFPMLSGAIGDGLPQQVDRLASRLGG